MGICEKPGVFEGIKLLISWIWMMEYMRKRPLNTLNARKVSGEELSNAGWGTHVRKMNWRVFRA